MCSFTLLIMGHSNLIPVVLILYMIKVFFGIWTCAYHMYRPWPLKARLAFTGPEPIVMTHQCTKYS